MKLVTLRNFALLQINVSEMVKFQNSGEDVFLKKLIFCYSITVNYISFRCTTSE